MPGALKYMISLDHPKVPFRGCEAPSLSNLFQATALSTAVLLLTFVYPRLLLGTRILISAQEKGGF